MDFFWGSARSSPSLPFFLGEGSPTKIDYKGFIPTVIREAPVYLGDSSLGGLFFVRPMQGVQRLVVLLSWCLGAGNMGTCQNRDFDSPPKRKTYIETYIVEWFACAFKPARKGYPQRNTDAYMVGEDNMFSDRRISMQKS